MRALAAVTLVLTIAFADVAGAATKRPRLKAFASCTQLVDYARAGAERTGGGVGVTGRAAPMPVDVVTTPPIRPPAERVTSAPPAAAPVSGESDSGAAVGGAVPEFSGTNVQEIGVDEPDILKTDGRRVFAVTDRTLRVIDVESGTVTGTLTLEGHGHQLLLRGDRVLAIAAKSGDSGPQERLDAQFPPGEQATIVTELDVSAAPKVLRTMEVPGRFVDARQNGAVARLVFEGAPAAVEDPAEASVRDFLGRTTLKSNLSGKTFRRNLTPCDAVSHPRRFSGLGVLAILTVDLDRGMYSLDRDGVMASAQVVYGSAGSLYVASHRYVRGLETGGEVPEGMQTEIHRFDITDPTKTVYRATGVVPGFILNNYALSEHEGKLRVASTEEPSWAPGSQQESQSTVTVLDQQGARLVRIGSVTGLGKGERIYAVRFMGEQGYVVTFRQIDPLYTLDLRDPKAPKVVGELKIPGYSAYLHPVGEGRLLGVGREGEAVQASLFDVSNPAAPARLAVLPFGSGSTPVENEPHAFTYWAPANLAVMPVESYGEAPFTGAAAIKIGPTSLVEQGRLEHETPERGQVPIQRSFVIGDRLYTLSYLGVLSSDIATLGAVKYTAF
ncbi:beta-propeller domain-containing protein [Solirubrobacter sp. CPCC 204708]|uniref:Beta-propeller domain-containing protein n=1 Tax=Solirubrobacter deserti TaxID=2282478 RepID=A0ABT4RTX2_9ACTN|nr:beta-propeller domain-containing protein [Solirubrobacter deserti]MBE2317265.1 beta-propeller domain-containing protein [Solirubrobacter deserti]MDA0142032.1 beta-propeller domain-containing protein [Solirubrobacter deserti]